MRYAKEFHAYVPVAIAMMVAVSVCVAWATGRGDATALSDEWVTVKPVTGILYLLSGTCVALHRMRLRFTTEFISITVITLAGAVWLTGPPAFLPSDADSIRTVAPGMPSVGTLIACLGLHGGLLVAAAHSRFKPAALSMMGLSALVSVCAIAGYVFNVPAMYYDLPEVSTAMAALTASMSACLTFSAIECQLAE